MKKVLSLILAAALVVSLAACAAAPAPAAAPAAEAAVETAEAVEEATAEAAETVKKWDLAPGSKIGIPLPSDSSAEVWVQAAESFKKIFGEAGYELEIQWANNNAANQVQNIESMIVNGCKALIVLPHDDSALGAVLETAKEEGILIINYDLPLRGTDAVDYYVGFDNRQVGVHQANYIVEQLGLDKGEKGPFNIELFAGSLSELNCYWYFDYAMEILQPYIDEGVLVVRSGQTDIEEVTVTDWNYELLTTRLEGLLTAYYSDGEHLDALLVPTDGIAQRVVPILQNVGYGDDIPMPVITGNNGNISVVKYIASGDIGMSIWKDRDLLAYKCLDIIEAAAAGVEPEGLEEFTPDKVTFKTLFGEMVVVTKDNLDELLIDTGVYTHEEVYGN